MPSSATATIPVRPRTRAYATSDPTAPPPLDLYVAYAKPEYREQAFRLALVTATKSVLARALDLIAAVAARGNLPLFGVCLGLGVGDPVDLGAQGSVGEVVIGGGVEPGVLVVGLPDGSACAAIRVGKAFRIAIGRTDA